MDRPQNELLKLYRTENAKQRPLKPFFSAIIAVYKIKYSLSEKPDVR